MPEPSDPELLRRQSSVNSQLDSTLVHAPAIAVATPGSPAHTGPRFQVLRSHASGGLGEIFVARDQEFGREVALKEIQEPLADDAQLRARFVVEGAITGCLEHPGIVPVYSLGHHPDGRPFYAMRFIRGESLRAAITHLHADGPADLGKQTFTLRQLLGRFVVVCNALAYAHSRGVIHRDVKPENIMLGPYGETLLVDWGLAKLVSAETAIESSPECIAPLRAEGIVQPSVSASAPTEFGAVVGTLAYMSPEQAAGLVDTLGPATDIYALGATLYVLLTGRTPFQQRTPQEIRSDVMAGRFPSPRQVNHTVPAPLAAICIKAMAIDPTRRYATSRQLADDLEAWMSDEPVKAWREPWRVRAGRWMRRHRMLVSSGIATLLVALVSLTAGVVLLTAANERERSAKNLAEDRRQESAKNFKTALGLMDKFFTKVSEDERLAEYGLEPLRRGLLAEARTVLTGIIADKPTDRVLLSEWAYMHVRLAYIVSQMGDEAESLTLLLQARETFESLVRDDPANSPDALKLVKTCVNLAASYQTLGRLSDAAATLERARRLDEALLQLKPDDQLARKLLATIYSGLARLEIRHRRTEEAEELFAKALQHYERVAAADASRENALAVAQTLNNLGIIANKSARHDEAYRHFTAARDRLGPTAAQVGRHPDYQREWGISHTGQGNACRHLPGRVAEGIAAYQTAIAAYRPLTETHRDVIDFQTDLATAHADLASLLADQFRLSEALPEYQAAEKVWRAVAAQHRDVPDYRNALARCQMNRALLLSVMERNDEAERAYGEAIAAREALVQEYGDVVEYRAALGETYSALGAYYLANDQFKLAEENLVKSLDTFANLGPAHANAVRIDAAGARALWSRAAAALGRCEEAVDAADLAIKALAGNEGTVVEQPAIGRILANAKTARADALSRLGRHNEALAAWAEIVGPDLSRAGLPARLGRAEALARAGKHDEAIAETKALAEATRGWGVMLYRLAVITTLAGKVVTTDTSLAEDHRDRRAEADFAAAVALLKQAADAGYFKRAAERERLKADTDLEPLRSRDDFRALLNDMK